MAIYEKIQLPFYVFASDQGNGVGNINANGDYSVTPETFWVGPTDPNDVIRLNRAILYIEDNSAFRVEGYGGLNAGLTNGINFTLERDGVPIGAFTGQRPVLTNGQWARYFYDIRLDTYGAGNSSLVGRWTFAKSGTPIRLSGAENDRVVITFNDDLTFLIDHTFYFQGFYETRNF